MLLIYTSNYWICFSKAKFWTSIISEIIGIFFILSKVIIKMLYSKEKKIFKNFIHFTDCEFLNFFPLSCHVFQKYHVCFLNYFSFITIFFKHNSFSFDYFLDFYLTCSKEKKIINKIKFKKSSQMCTSSLSWRSNT